MKHYPLPVSLLLTGAVIMLAGGCTPAADRTERISNRARKAVYDTAEKVQQLVAYQPVSNIKQTPAAGFCYRTLGDIICYDAPQPYISNKLFGMQGYKSPAVPASVIRAPRNAALMGGPDAFTENNNVAMIPAESDVVQMPPKNDAKVADAKEAKAPEAASGDPALLMPRY